MADLMVDWAARRLTGLLGVATGGAAAAIGLIVRLLKDRHAAREREELLGRLTLIQRSISHRVPLEEVLEAITTGAGTLLGDEIIGIRLVDEDDPGWARLVTWQGVRPDQLPHLLRTRIGDGVGGRAISEDRLVVEEHYQSGEGTLPVFAHDRLQAAMAAPVRIDGVVSGSLVTASYVQGRRYSRIEQEVLLAFAEHASLALTDAKTVEAMRQAQQAQELFLATVSHELKTPLTVVMGTLRTIQHHGDELGPERRAAMLDTAFDRGRDLEKLIDRLLQGSRAELATILGPAHLPQLVADALRGFDESRLVTGDVPDLRVIIDAGAVEAVIGTLVENALAHAPAESPIRVEASADDEHVRVAVSNRGRLPDVPVGELFQPFLRGPGVSSSGVGLGLYIAAQLAAALGGDLDAHDAGDRVTFTLRFPHRPAG